MDHSGDVYKCYAFINTTSGVISTDQEFVIGMDKNILYA